MLAEYDVEAQICISLLKDIAAKYVMWGSVTLGDEEARRRGSGRKSVLERAQPPTFDAAVELLGRRRWRVHADLAAAVDRLLAGKP